MAGRAVRAGEQQVQRPCVGREPGMLEKRERDPVLEREVKDRGGGQRAAAEGRAGPRGPLTGLVLARGRGARGWKHGERLEGSGTCRGHGSGSDAKAQLLPLW